MSMANLACNQHHLRGGSSACPRVSLCGTSDINEHVPLWQSGIRALRKLSVDFCCIVKCSRNPESFFLLSFSTIISFVPLFASPHLSCQPAHPASSFKEAFRAQLPYPPFSFYLLFFPLFLVTVGTKAFRVMTGWKDARTEKWGCDYCKLLFRMSVLAETWKNKHDKI